MSEYTFTIRSSIKSSLMRFVLLRGTILGGIGGFVLLISGIFLPIQFLRGSGFFLFALGMALISFGLLPYRKLKKLEMNPAQLVLDHQNNWHYILRGKPILTLPIESIDHVTYLEKDHLYGIGILLKRPLPQKIVIHDPSFDVKRLQKEGCDLFFSFFSQRAYQDFLESSQTTPLK